MVIETRYDGPVKWVELSPAGRTIQLFAPAEPDRLLEAEEVLAANCRDEYMPYWAYLWPGAYLLAEAVARRRWPEGTRALEIGCGLGYAGLAGLKAGLSVDFTDYDAAPFPFVAESARANGLGPERWSTQRLDWREPPDQTYPVILGADVLYERRLVPLVARLISRMMAPGGETLVAGPYRVATEDLGPTLAEYGLICEATPLETRDAEGRSVRGMLQHIRHAVSP